MSATTLDKIEDRGNRTVNKKRDNLIKCKDGFELSVVADMGAYCLPRPQFIDVVKGIIVKDYDGPFTHVEVGYPSKRPEPWIKWSEFSSDEGAIFGWVPIDLVRDLIELHGGEA